MSTLSYPIVTKRQSNAGILKRLWAGFVAARERRSEDYAMSCLSTMSPDQPKELGYSANDVKASDSHCHLTPPSGA